MINHTADTLSSWQPLMGNDSCCFNARPLLNRTMIPLINECVCLRSTFINNFTLSKTLFAVWGSWIDYALEKNYNNNSSNNFILVKVFVLNSSLCLIFERAVLLTFIRCHLCPLLKLRLMCVNLKHRALTSLSPLCLYRQKQRPIETRVHFVEKCSCALIKNAC